MHLYNLTLHRAGAVSEAIYGNFSGLPKSQEIVLARGKVLCLLRPDESGELETICEVEVFGLIRTIKPLRMTGDTRDYVVIGSDSGCLAILEYHVATKRFNTVHCESFGKTGIRRISPGEFLAVDPQGRAVMIGAVEKQKFVYVTNRDAAARLTISSPLEAHKSHVLVYDLKAVDVGYDNPLFAAIEVNYRSAKSPEAQDDHEDQPLVDKYLTFYELDLGLNHVIRKHSEKLKEYHSNHLITVPGGEFGPGGMLVCSDLCVSYYHLEQEMITCYLPKRFDHFYTKEDGVKKENGESSTDGLATAPEKTNGMVICSAVLGQKGLMFILVQTELGDLFRVTIGTKAEDATVVERLEVEYFDTIQPCRSLCITRKGLLFAATEAGNHVLYQIADRPEGVNGGERQLTGVICTSTDDITRGAPDYPTFVPRTLAKLRFLDQLPSLSPCLGLTIADLNSEMSKQLYLLTGSTSTASISTLRSGLMCGNVANTSLPGKPYRVFTVKEKEEDEVDKYIVVSFVNVTLVLSVGTKVEQVKDSGLVTTAQSLAVGLMKDNSVVQVHEQGIRHIKKSAAVKAENGEADVKHEPGSLVDWKSGNHKVIAASLGARQVCLALDNNELVSFELDEINNLCEVARVSPASISVGQGTDFLSDNQVTAIDLKPSAEASGRSEILAVGYKQKMLRIFSLTSEKGLEELGLQALPDVPHSLCFSTFDGYDTTLCIGLRNGVLVRTQVEERTGQINESISTFLGTRPVSLCRVVVNGISCVTCLSSRSWLLYQVQKRSKLNPLSYDRLQFAASFSNEQCEGLVAVTDSSLRIFYVENMDMRFNTKKTMLTYTPRKLVCHPTIAGALVVLEGDHGVSSLGELNQSIEVYNKLRKEKYGESEPLHSMTQAEDDMEDDEEDEEEEEMKLSFAQTGYPCFLKQNPDKPGGSDAVWERKWCSVVKVVNPNTEKVLSVFELDHDEYGVSMCLGKFKNRSDEKYLVVGSVVGLDFSSKGTQRPGCLKLFRFMPDGSLSLFNTTPVKDVPRAVCTTPDGKLLVGLGSSLCIYELGEKHLLLKADMKKSLPTTAVQIKVAHKHGETQDQSANQVLRVFVADAYESITVFNYYPAKAPSAALALLADDVSPRISSCFEVLDFDTAVGSDKFGNIFVLRLPEQLDNALESNAKLKLWDQGNYDGAPNKLYQVCQFFVGDIVTGMQKASLAPGRPEALFYSTINGSVGVLVPFATQEDTEFFIYLQNQCRQVMQELVGNDSLTFRSAFIPAKGVVDGDLVDQFFLLEKKLQKEMADEIDRSITEVANKIDNLFMRLI